MKSVVSRLTSGKGFERLVFVGALGALVFALVYTFDSSTAAIVEEMKP
ncbi:MAG: hypothetical protein ACWA40_00670 [Planktomarina sp.]